MTFKNLKKFLFNPKLYITKLVDANVHNRMIHRRYLPINQTNCQDVFLAGFPKSGNTWLQNIIAGIILNMDTENLSDTLSQSLVPDIHSANFYKRFYEPMFFKTHHLPSPEYQKVIHLIRDGRDALWSYYQMKTELGEKITLEEMVLENKGLFPCSWQQHTRAWLENPYNANLLIIKYELLISDPLSELKKICDFIDLERTEKDLHKIIKGNSFSKMKKKESIFGGYNKHLNPNGNFLRKGIIGDFKEGFSPGILQEFENLAGKELAKLGYL